MNPDVAIGRQPGRRALRWCLWVAGVSLAVALISGFAGMANKETCLPLPDHCDSDYLQAALVILYFGSLIVLALCLLVALLLGVGVVFRRVHWSRKGDRSAL